MRNIFDNSYIIILGLAVFIVIIVISHHIRAAVENKRLNRPLDIDTFSIYDTEFHSAIHKIALDNVSRKYYILSKPIVTKKGAYRATFLNDVEKERRRITDEYDFWKNDSLAFKTYVKQNYPEIKVKDLETVIDSYIRYEEVESEIKLDGFVSSEDFITINEFNVLKSKQTGDIVGVYIIYNSTQNMYYVGQATRLFFRVNQHFTGHGNGDIYADYKYGDAFFVKIVKLSESGYDDLNLLEKDLIKEYNAYTYGYNKTKGNSV